MSARGHEYLHFDPFLFVGRVSKECSMFTWILISTFFLCGLNTSRPHKSNYTTYIDLVVWNMHGC